MKKNEHVTTFAKILLCTLLAYLSNVVSLQAQCPGLGSVSFTVVPAPQPTLNFAPSICTSQTTSITVNQSFNTYAWSTGNNSNSITVSQGGTYTVTVTNAAGCEGTAEAIITQAPGLIFSITSPPYTCNGLATLVAGGNFPNYLWDNGSTNNQIVVASSGTYTVTATNASGCTGTAEFVVTIPPDPQVDITGNANLCANTSTALTATPGFQTYQWSGGVSSGNTTTVSGSGTYTVTVTNTFGCTDTDTFVVTTQPAPVPVLNAPAPACAGQSVEIAVQNPIFQGYAWSNGGSGPGINVSNSGTYTVTVTDAAGCTGTSSTTLTVNPSLNISITQQPYACNEQRTLSATSGFSSYAWSNGASGATIAVSVENTYTVTVTGANGCTGTAEVLVTIPPDPQVDITGNASLCANTSTVLTATPGFQTYQWSGGVASGNTTTVSGSGTYTVTVTNTFGCTDTDTFVVTTQPAPVPVLNAPAPICAGQSVEIAVQNAIFQDYDWSNGDTGTSINVSNSGTYTVTVTNTAGCTGTASTTLTVNPNPNISITQQPYACNGQRTLSATPGFPNYAWSNGASGAIIVVSVEDSYTVTVTGANGCTNTAVVDAEIPPAPVVEVVGVTSICQGQTTAFSATAGFSTYAWSSGQSTPTITISTSGTYFVTVTDSFGCTDVDSESLDVNPLPQPAISGPTQICAGGTATFAATGGVFSSYAWSTGNTTSSISASNAGNYTVTVSNAEGCTATASINLSIGSALNINIVEQPFNCNGQIVLDAGAGFQTYNWSTGAATSTISVSTNDDYSVTVSDATGCTGSATIAVIIPDLPQVAITGVPEICNGTTTTLSATSGFAAYVWSNAQFNQAITVGSAGTYGVTVTDIKGCTASASFSLAVAAAPAPQILGISTICQNTSTLLAVNAVFDTYEWSTGAITPTTTVSSAGNYTVTVTNAAGCTGSDDFILNVNSSLQPQITQQPYLCNGNITLNAGAGFQTYTWSNAANTQTINVTQNGNYTVTVSDAGGCTGSAVLAVTIPTAPQVSITGSQNFCDGASTVITATTGFANYNWSNGASTAQIEVFQSENFGLTVTDAIGCTATANYAVTENPLPQVQILGSTTLCNGSAATLSASQNFPNYAWSTGETTAQVSVSTAGTVGLTVTDANGCTALATVNLTVATALSPQITQQPYLCNGTITLDAGAGFQTYTWSNAANTQTINVTQNGNYTVTVSDAGGCTGSAVLGVTIPIAPQVAISGNQTFCDGGSTVLSATSGFANYNWSNGSNTAQIEVFQSGNFGLTVTDAIGCTATASFTATENPLPQVQILGSTTLCNGSAATLSASQNFANYAWSTGETTAQIAVSTAGAVGLTVTDANGCTALATANLTVGTALSPQISQQPYLCNGNLTLDAGAGYQTYTWSNAANTQTINVAQNGNYTVTVSDASGCTGSAVLAVTIPTAPQVLISGNQNFCDGGSTVISATSGFANYNWSNGANTAQTEVFQTGNFGLTVTDAIGCTATANYAVTENPLPQVQILGSTTLCNGSAATLSASQNFPNYAWSTGETTAQISVLTVGTVGLTVTDANGCTASTAANLTVGNSLSPQISQQPFLCDGNLTLDAGAGFQTYAWSNAANTQTINVAQNGNYTVTVSDTGGCTGSAVFAVTIPAAPQVLISGNDNFCNGSSTVISATAGFINYSWSNGANTAQITVAQVGNYEVTITDGNGCTDTASISVTEITAELPEISGSSTICVGGSTLLTVSNAANFSQILWSNGTAAAQISVAAAGNYTVTATEATGCTASTEFVVTVGNTLTPTIDENAYLCDGNITLEAPSGFEAYVWSNGSGTAMISVSVDGNYALTVTDASGCTGTASIFVQVPDEILVVVQTPPTPICPGGSAQLSIAPGFSNYQWSTGATGNAIQISVEGNYGVTVTDLYGCTAADTYTFEFAKIPVFDIGGSPLLDCENLETNLNLDLQNVLQPAAYLWSNGSVSDAISAQTPGVFSVTVTDANGCTANTSVEVLKVSVATTFADTIEFTPGEVLNLSPLNLNFTPTTVSWSPAAILNCTDCPTVEARPTEAVQVDYSGVSGDCSHKGYFYLFSKKKKEVAVFAPNVILLDSPDNGSFTLFGNELMLGINYLQVYTRWGELVVELQNLAPGDVSAGWKGEFRDKRVDPGVFVWVAEVLLSDGTVKIYKGDVTVVR